MLLDTISKVRSNSISLDKAGAIAKLASQVNHSLYAEAQAAISRVEAGETVSAIGSMDLTGAEESK